MGNYLREKFASSIFDNEVTLPAMKCPATKIYPKPDAVPYAQHTRILTPYQLKAQVKAILDSDFEYKLSPWVALLIGAVPWLWYRRQMEPHYPLSTT